jgi:hypothetical protein
MNEGHFKYLPLHPVLGCREETPRHPWVAPRYVEIEFRDEHSAEYFNNHGKIYTGYNEWIEAPSGKSRNREGRIVRVYGNPTVTWAVV